MRTEWIRLDNASKIFPPNHNSVDTKVFRVSVYLNEPVDPVALQAATEETYHAYPLLQYVLRKGVFWYYLQRYDLTPRVTEEDLSVCATIYKANERSLLFRVSYFQTRINFEIFHVLTDGTGAFFLFQELLYRYLVRVHPPQSGATIPPPNDRASLNQLMQDSFRRYYTKSATPTAVPDTHPAQDPVSKLKHHAAKLKGTRNLDYHLTVIEGKMDVRQVLEAAHQHGVTLTIDLAALWIQCMEAQLPETNTRPIALSVPVNLRQYFPSMSARNFFATIRVGFSGTGQDASLETIADHLERSFKEELSQDKLQAKLNRLMKLERNPFLRIVPVIFKDPFMNIGHRWVDRSVTSSLSNLGRIRFPESLAPYIDRFSVCTSARRIQMCVCTWNEKLVIAFTTPDQETEAIRAFFTSLTGAGIDVELTTNTGLEPEAHITAQTPSPRDAHTDQREDI